MLYSSDFNTCSLAPYKPHATFVYNMTHVAYTCDAGYSVAGQHGVKDVFPCPEIGKVWTSTINNFVCFGMCNCKLFQGMFVFIIRDSFVSNNLFHI